MLVVGRLFRFFKRSVGISETISYADFADRVADFLISKDWTRNYYARDKHGEHTDIRSFNAASFCSLGAIMYNHEELKPYIKDEDMMDWKSDFTYYLINAPEYNKYLSEFNRDYQSAIVYWNDNVRWLNKNRVVNTFRNFAREQRSLENQKYLAR